MSYEKSEDLNEALRQRALIEQIGEEAEPLTHAQLVAIFDRTVEDLNGLDKRQGGDGACWGVTSLTCYRCPGAHTCPFVGDMYNTGGDCLASK